MLTDTLKAVIAQHAIECYPQECCGLIVDGDYFRCRNESAEPTEAFEIHPEDYVAAETYGTVQAIVHSHPNGKAEPSSADKEGIEATDVPWIICNLGAQLDGSIAVEQWGVFHSTGYTAPLVGCPFTHGTQDCYGLIRRYYFQKHGITLPDFYRAFEWWDDGKSDLYTAGFPQAGFIAMPEGTEYELGDVLLMRIHSRNNVPNHAAVYTGGGSILHHCYRQLSRHDSLARYMPYVTHHLRYKEQLWKR